MPLVASLNLRGFGWWLLLSSKADPGVEQFDVGHDRDGAKSRGQKDSDADSY